jgi:dTDP-4-dehydrorhamnose 3,5-epimerase
MNKEKPMKHEDNRGYFSTIMLRDLVQVNLSHSYQGVIRGMHTQKKGYEQGKQLYLLEGVINDVIINKDTLEVYSFILKKGESLWVPKNYLHGFEVLSHKATLLYGVDSAYSPMNELCVKYDSIGYKWRTTNPVLSVKDSQGMSLEDFVKKEH